MTEVKTQPVAAAAAAVAAVAAVAAAVAAAAAIAAAVAAADDAARLVLGRTGNAASDGQQCLSPPAHPGLAHCVHLIYWPELLHTGQA